MADENDVGADAKGGGGGGDCGDEVVEEVRVVDPPHDADVVVVHDDDQMDADAQIFQTKGTDGEGKARVPVESVLVATYCSLMPQECLQKRTVAHLDPVLAGRF